ncbi:hypothetical protein B7494_g3539 [Chlorociboria aeruginascens]|nr:hypothetical protein B7494_g3539 [Chlorociboria aeruginascens]
MDTTEVPSPTPAPGSPSQEITDQVTNLAFIALVISIAFAYLYMVAIQYLLLTIHYSRRLSLRPSAIESSILVFLFWLFHFGLDRLFSWAVDSIVISTLAPESSAEYMVYRATYYNLNSFVDAKTWGLGPEWAGVLLLGYECWLTWLIFQSLLFTLNHFIPFTRSIFPCLSSSPKRKNLGTRFLDRCGRIYMFLTTIDIEERAAHLSTSDPFPIPLSTSAYAYTALSPSSASPSDDEDCHMNVDLERQQCYSPTGGHKVLSWNFAVGRKALREMKANLGPAGGFGELGFSVLSDRVYFGAMGGSTRVDVHFCEIGNNEKDLEW